MVEMASGTVAFDLVQSGAKRLFELEWTSVSDTDKTALETAYDSLGTATAAFVMPTGGGTATVTRTDREIQFTFTAAADMRWNATMELREA